MANRLAEIFGGEVASGTTETGGGSIPGHGVPTWRVALPTGKADRQLKELRQREIRAAPVLEARERLLAHADARGQLRLGQASGAAEGAEVGTELRRIRHVQQHIYSLLPEKLCH